MTTTGEINSINDYVQSSKTICLSTTVAVLLIFIFVISPLKQFMFSSIVGRLAILTILGYALFRNSQITYGLFKITSSTAPKGSNLLCSGFFSIFILILFLSVVKTFF
jgi:protein-S-isoprenylcysteine O-methyltransferase Ste14